MIYRYNRFTIFSFAATAVVSASATAAVIARPIPLSNLIPFGNATLLAAEAGITIVITGVSVPTVGAVALSYSFTNLAAAFTFEIYHP
jgi:hypothetical protein